MNEQDIAELTSQHLKINDLYIKILENNYSSHQELRKSLRQQIAKRIETSEGRLNLKNITDLDKVPQDPNLGISISHCPTTAVYIVSFEQLNLGVDIEDSKRIKREILQRVCSEKEVLEAPDLASLWTAKEAAYKSYLKLKQPKVLSEIKIFNWRKVSESANKFSYLANDSRQLADRGEGLSMQNKCLNLSICKI